METKKMFEGGKTVWLLSCFLLTGIQMYAQKTCTSNPTTISSDVNFNTIAWTASGGATAAECNNMRTGTAFTGDVVVDIANNKTITVTTNLNITGNFILTGGPGSTLSVTGGHTVHVFGNSNYMGDPANNGVQYNVAASSDKIIVDGTLYGKNNNAFTGNGSISGGTLNVKNGATCGSPCPVSGGFSNCTSGDAFCSNSGALPITLLYFNASIEESSVEVRWATSMQENFDKFILERSTNGKTFESLTEILGEGKNVEDIENKYSFIDNNPKLGLNYYRIKAVDLDGSFNYHKSVAVDFSGNKKISVTPNPSNGNTVKFSVNFTPDQLDRIVLVNNLGQEVASGNASELNGQIVFDTPLNTGVYVLKYFVSGAELNTRLMIN
jgi:hypothetical protein